MIDQTSNAANPGEVCADSSPALLLGWGYGETSLGADLRDAARKVGKGAVFTSARIERGRIRTPYHMVVIGIGDVGHRVIKELPVLGSRRGGWCDSPLLLLWNLQINFGNQADK